MTDMNMSLATLPIFDYLLCVLRVTFVSLCLVIYLNTKTQSRHKGHGEELLFIDFHSFGFEISLSQPNVQLLTGFNRRRISDDLA